MEKNQIKPDTESDSHVEALPCSLNQNELPPSSTSALDRPSQTTVTPTNALILNQQKNMHGSPIRKYLGSGTTSLSDFINDNFIAVRYASVATIGLLAVYGIAHTPFFFRYRTVSEIPHEYFRRRRKLPCRIVKMEPFRPNQPILYMRHLSPVERLMFSKSSFEWFMNVQPSFRRRPDQDSSQLLKVVVAGINMPPLEDGWVEGLVADKTVVTCQLLARSVPDSDDNKQTQWTAFDKKFSTSSAALAASSSKKRPIPNLDLEFDNHASTSGRVRGDDPRTYGDDQIAVCKVFFRHESSLPLFKTDLAMVMIRSGRAVALEDSLYHGSSNAERLVDTSESVKDLQRDASYLNQLAQLEYEAAKGFYGVWSDHAYREQRKDVVDEVEFQSNATRLQKLWRWIRGG